MSIRATINLPDGEALLPSYRANKIGPWVFLILSNEDFERSVAADPPAADPFGLRLPGFWILDARSHWKFDARLKNVVVFSPASIIQPNVELPRVGRTNRACLALVDSPGFGRKQRAVTRNYESPTPRLSIDQIRRDLIVRGEVFVVPTRVGYAPAVHVETIDGSIHHLLVGASSIALPLEKWRLQNGGKLDGVRFSIFKSSPARTAPYILEIPFGG
jgi:hypothetical protein